MHLLYGSIILYITGCLTEILLENQQTFFLTQTSQYINYCFVLCDGGVLLDSSHYCDVPPSHKTQ